MRGKQKLIYHYKFTQYDQNKNIIKNKYYLTRSDIMADNNITYTGITERLLCKVRQNARLYLDINISRINIPVYTYTQQNADLMISV
jgi:hypothetical protein|tara:strand:- start:684 stop:944 length:261 start_codon:yes stop_codon:yes gene_type:complete